MRADRIDLGRQVVESTLTLCSGRGAGSAIGDRPCESVGERCREDTVCELGGRLDSREAAEALDLGVELCALGANYFGQFLGELVDS